MQTEIARLQKPEWVNAYAQAREKAFSALNIFSAFSRAGLFLFYLLKVL